MTRIREEEEEYQKCAVDVGIGHITLMNNNDDAKNSIHVLTPSLP